MLEFGEIPPIKGELIEGKVCWGGHPLLKITENDGVPSRYKLSAIIAIMNSLSVKEFITDVASGSVLILYVLTVFSMQTTQVSII